MELVNLLIKTFITIITELLELIPVFIEIKNIPTNIIEIAFGSSGVIIFCVLTFVYKRIKQS